MSDAEINKRYSRAYKCLAWRFDKLICYLKMVVEMIYDLQVIEELEIFNLKRDIHELLDENKAHIYPIIVAIENAKTCISLYQPTLNLILMDLTSFRNYIDGIQLLRNSESEKTITNIVRLGMRIDGVIGDETLNTWFTFVGPGQRVL